MRISDWSSDVCSSDLILRGHFSAVPAAKRFRCHQRKGRLAEGASAKPLKWATHCRAACLHQNQPNKRKTIANSATRIMFGVELIDAKRELPFKALGCDVHQCAKLCVRSEEHTSELQSLMRISYAVYC